MENGYRKCSVCGEQYSVEGWTPSRLNEQRTCGHQCGATLQHREGKTRNTPLADRFREKVEIDPKTGCWIWTGHTTGRSAQPCVWDGKRFAIAARVALLLAGRDIPAGQRVYRSCGNPRCVAPDHALCGEVARFWTMVEKSDGCWLWTGTADKRGRGRFRSDLGREQAPRFSWRLHNGPIPDDKLVCHKCDVPACVRPDHLFLGTQQENVQDCIRKGRRKKRRITSAAAGDKRRPEV